MDKKYKSHLIRKYVFVIITLILIVMYAYMNTSNNENIANSIYEKMRRDNTMVLTTGIVEYKKHGISAAFNIGVYSGNERIQGHTAIGIYYKVKEGDTVYLVGYLDNYEEQNYFVLDITTGEKLEKLLSQTH